MRRKKFLAFALASVLSICMNIPTYAAEIVPSTEELPIVETQITSGGITRASWGHGILHASNPIGAKPRAYAETKTYSGTAYRLTAQTVVIDANSITTSTNIMSASNSTHVSSATIISPTEKAFFVGNHTIQDTSTSGTQTCQTSKDYKS